MTTTTRPVPTKPFQLAMTILDLPVGLTFKELQKQARVYLRNLSPEEYDKLKDEALSERGEYRDDYADKLDLFRQLGFTPRECQAYAGMRIDSPGVRRMIARRALLMAMRGWDKLPTGMIHPDVCKMEDAFLTVVANDQVVRPYTDDEILAQLQQIRRLRR